MPQQRRRRIHLKRQHLALDRAHGRQIGGRDAADLARPGTRRQHHDIGRLAAAIGDHSGDAVTGQDRLADSAMLDQLDPGLSRRDGEGAAEIAVLDLVVPRTPHRGGDAGLQMRLALPRLGGIQPMQVEPEALLEFIGMAQLHRVIAVQRNNQGTLVAIVDRHAGGRFQLARELRPHALAFERQRQ